MAEPLMGSAAPRAESLHRLGLQGFLVPSGLQTQIFVHPIDAQTSYGHSHDDQDPNLEV